MVSEKELFERCRMNARKRLEALDVDSKKVEDIIAKDNVKIGVFEHRTGFMGAYYKKNNNFYIGIDESVLQDPKCGDILAHEMLHAVGLPDHHWFAEIQCKWFGRCRVDTRELFREVPFGECCYMKDMNCPKLDSLCERDLTVRKLKK